MAFKTLRNNTKTQKNKNICDPAKHIGDGLPIFDEEDEYWELLEKDEDDIAHGDWSDICIPEEALAFPTHLAAGNRAFRHILVEGAHCLL